MARYLLTDNAFLPDGRFYEATLESPKILAVPDDMPPSLHWKPLDKAAHAALVRLADQQRETSIREGMDPKQAEREFHRHIKPLPKGIKEDELPDPQLSAMKIKPPATRDRQEDAALRKLVDAAKPPEPGVVTMAPSGRASDQEPK